ncbi:MAG: hypothetical protein RLZZ511_1296 [Cyanobacteriota bacterium]
MISSRSRRSFRLTLVTPSLLLSLVPLISTHRTIAQPAPFPTTPPITPAVIPSPAVQTTPLLLDPIPDLQLPPGLQPPREPADPRNPLANITIDSLIDELRTANRSRHESIVNELVKRGKSAIPPLTKALEINDPLVRRGVATALGKFQEAAIAAVPALVKLTADNRRALFPRREYDDYPSLTVAPPEPIPFYSSSARSRPTPPDNPRNLVSITALGALGQIGPAARRTATEPLTQLLKTEDPWVKLHAAWALNQMGAETPILSTYLALLQHPDQAVRTTANDAIGNDPLITKVIGAEASPAIIQQLVQALAINDDRSNATLWNLLRTVGAEAVPSLTAALKSPNPALRSNAAQALGKIGKDARSAIPALIPLLNDPSQSMILAPVPAFEPSSIRAIEPALAPAYYGDYGNFPVPPNANHLVRIDAMIAIAQILGNARETDDRPIAATTQLLQDRDPATQLAAAWLLERLRGSNQASTAIYIKSLTQPELREASKGFFATLVNGPIRIPNNWLTATDRRNLLQLISDPDPTTQRIASQLLSSFGAAIVPDLIPLLRSPDIRTKHAAIDILSNIGQPASSALPNLTALLQDVSSYTIPETPWGWGSASVIGPQIAVSPWAREASRKSYSQVFFPNENEILTRSKAIDAIGRIGISNPETQSGLNQLAQADQNQIVRLKATWAAIVLGSDEKAYLPFLEETLNASKGSVQNTTRNILEAIGKPGAKILMGHYLKRLDNPELRVNTVLWLGNNRLGGASLAAVRKIRPYLEGSDSILRGYTVTILANIADSIIADARSDQLSDRELKTAIEEYTKVNEITQKPNAKFNAQPVERLQNALNQLKRYQTDRSRR